MKTTDFHPTLDISLSLYDLPGLLAARRRIDQAIQNLVAEHQLIASYDALALFQREHPEYRRVVIEETQQDLYLSVLQLWMKAEKRPYFENRLKQQKRDWHDGFLLDELLIEGFSLRLIGNPKLPRIRMLWAYLSYFGIFRPDKRLRRPKAKA